jgi:hypothetical protein
MSGLGAVGCTIKATKMATGHNYGDDCSWQSEDALTIRGVNGRIEVSEGADDVIAAEFRPFVLIADDATDSEEQNELDKLHGTVELDETSRTVTVETARDDDVLSSLGADITVSIPPNFDGPLRVEQNNGPVVVESAAHARGFTMVSENGSCDVGLGSARAVDLLCGFGDLTVNVPVIAQNFESATLRTGRGDIELRFPADGVFSVRALSNTGGSVDMSDAEASGCSVLVASESSKTAVCNGATEDDPVYDVTADAEQDAMLSHDILLRLGAPPSDSSD